MLYAGYSICIYMLSARRSEILPTRLLHWFDLAWYVPLLALCSGTNNLFFFFFAILVASFGWGYNEGLRATAIASLVFAIGGQITSSSVQGFEINPLPLRFIDLLALGFMIAYWGGYEIKLRERLRLLKEVSILSNPRFGVDRTIQSIIASLRSSYQADTCFLILMEALMAGHIACIVSIEIVQMQKTHLVK